MIKGTSLKGCEGLSKSFAPQLRLGTISNNQYIVGEKFKEIEMASRLNPFKFLQEVRAETAKVVWPTRNETLVTTVMVLIMVFLATLFFLAIDQILGWGISALLSIGR